MLKIKRVYERFDPEDGFRILIDRIWPRGESKEKAHLDLWLKDLAPSTDLRKWFGHDPKKFPEFKARYLAELTGENKQTALNQLKFLLQEHPVVTLIYSAKDEVHNNAVVLQELLEK